MPGEGDDLIFGASPRTDSTVDDFFDLSSITFTADAPAYTITVLPLSGLTLSNPASLSRQTLGPIEDGVLLGNASKNLGLIILGGAKSPEETLGGLLIVTFFPLTMNSHVAGPAVALGAPANGPIELRNEGATISGGAGGLMEFHGFASADNYTIINNPGQVMGALPGSTFFFDNSTAENATLVNNSYTAFNDDSTLGSATLTNNGSGSVTVFTGSSTAGAGSILTTRAADRVGGANLQFSNLSSTGSATITTNGGFELNDFSGSFTIFNGASTAGSATLITNGGMVAGAGVGHTLFFDSSDGGTARAVTKAGADFDISGLGAAGMGIGSIEGAGTYLLGTKNLSVGGNDRSTTVAGVIEGADGSLTKVGLGSLTLSGANAYTGGTTVDGSILFVDNSSGSGTGSGAVMVNSGGFLGGSGTIAGTVTVNSGGTVSPGRSPGKLSINGNYIQKSGAALDVELGGDASGTGFDQLAIDGSATLDGTLNVSLVNGFRPAVGAIFQILTSQSVSGNFAIISSSGFKRAFSGE